MSENIIVRVDEQGVCAGMGITPGDLLVSINNQPVKDVFDYRYYMQDSHCSLLIRKPDGAEYMFDVEKDEAEDFGLTFAGGLMDDAKRCNNKCMFCFIDQLPKQMRPTLYFKDDDSRLSFLTGNYVTLTNMTDADLSRIMFYHLSPINISVHTTDPALRVKMLNNPKAADLMPKLKQLYDAGISMNYQVVLCKGVNDGAHLDRTIMDLAELMPLAGSLSVVPAGLTKYRERLPSIMPFGAEDSKSVLLQVESFQRQFRNKYQTRFVYPADEFYLNAGIPYPPHSSYEGFPQLENGVGMLALFEHEFLQAMRKLKKKPGRGRVSIITGTAAGPFMRRLCDIFMKTYNIAIDLHVIGNSFFGDKITVSGLLTGRDILAGLKGRRLCGKLLIPSNALRDGVFLDDISINDISAQLNLNATAVNINGFAFAEALLKGADFHA